MKPTLSLIIPVYKAEAFIEDCLRSVFLQLPEQVEVVLVDDGSPDKSIEIVRREFCQWINCGQMVLLSQQNMGPGAARNLGIRKSSGEFIAFLDSDDVLLDGYFREIFESLDPRRGADIVEFGFKRFHEVSQIAEVPYAGLYAFEGLQRLEEVRERVFAAGCWYPWTRVYRRQILERHLFPVGTHYEDLMTIPFIYLEDLMVLFINKPLLGYRYNPGSITSNHTVKHLIEKYDFYRSIPLESTTDSEKILKLKTARGIIFFRSELVAKEFPVSALLTDIRMLSLGAAARKALLMPDWFFLNFPALYIFLDRLRVPLKIALSRLKAFNSRHSD